jgi:hypothetical protein
MEEGGRSRGRREWLCRVSCLLLFPVSAKVRGVRVTDVPLYATLRGAATARLGARECAAAEGNHVELVSEVAGPGVGQGADRRWFARLITGPCAGAELTVPESLLGDQRSQPEPTAAPRSPPSR